MGQFWSGSRHQPDHDVVFGVTVGVDMGSLADKCSIPGVSTSVGDIPEGTAEVDRSVFVRD